MCSPEPTKRWFVEGPHHRYMLDGGEYGSCGSKSTCAGRRSMQGTARLRRQCEGSQRRASGRARGQAETESRSTLSRSSLRMGSVSSLRPVIATAAGAPGVSKRKQRGAGKKTRRTVQRGTRGHTAPNPRSSGCPTAGMSRPPSPVAPGTRAQHADSGAEATGARATKSGAYAQRRAGAGRVTYQRRREVRQRRAPASPRAAPAVLHRQPWCRALTVCLRRAPSPELTKPQKAGQNLGQRKIVARLDHWSSLWGLGGQVRVEIGGKDGSGRR